MLKRLTRPLRLMLASLMLALMLFVSGCATTSGFNRAEECAWTKPIGWSEQDTEETQKEIFAHNLKWEEFCPR